MRAKSSNRSRNVDVLARVQLTESQRVEAAHFMQQGERIAELLIAAVTVIRAAARRLERSIRTFTGSRSAG
jgi:hypothetical protein